jgi:hypothetical protein
VNTELGGNRHRSELIARVKILLFELSSHCSLLFIEAHMLYLGYARALSPRLIDVLSLRLVSPWARTIQNSEQS